MIRLQRITTADTDLYSYMEKLMTQSFPSEEYRELEELRKYTDTKTHFYNNIIFHNNTPVGLITYWDFGHFYYIEHFAIDSAQRNGGWKERTEPFMPTLKTSHRLGSGNTRRRNG